MGTSSTAAPGSSDDSNGVESTSDSPPAETTAAVDETSGGPHVPEHEWCLYEVYPSADGSPLNVYAEPDASATIQYTLADGERVWGRTSIVDGFRDLNRDLDLSAWAEVGRLSNTGQCEDDEDIPDPPPDLPPPDEPALPQGFQLPFVCGDAWRLDSWGHAPALDMVREPDQVGTEGAPLRAPAPGTVNMSFYHDNAGNVVQIDHGEGWFTTYLHMESRAVEVGAVVARGDTIGAVGRTGPTSNDHPHLHFELGVDADGDGEASWGFEGAERVNPWFDGIEYGQENALTWRDVVSNNCP
ncbi:MAG TPA: M23 family metallopeptidase [Nannocystaceae bacterium]|nr:M23 family metallopeptidase [Nannocystaceae bacterium]